MDMLVALGKDHDTLTLERLSAKAWPLACTWMVGEQVRDLFVLRAHLLPADRWKDLRSIPGARGMRLWLVVHTGAPTPAQTAALSGTTWKRMALEEFNRQWPDGSSAPPAAEPSPMLPADSFLVFRAACRWTLTPQQFERVDATYLRCLGEAATWLAAWPEGTALCRPAVHAFLQRLTADCHDAGEALVRFRAAQAQLFRNGWLLTATGQESAAVDPSDSFAHLDRPRAARLRALADPRATALGAMVLLSEAAVESVLGTKVGQCGPRHLDIDGNRYAIPPWARGLVTTLVRQRRQAGARAGSRLFVDRAGAAPMDLNQARAMLDALTERTRIRFQIPFPSFWGPKRAPPDSWLSLEALRLVQIGDPPRKTSPWFD